MAKFKSSATPAAPAKKSATPKKAAAKAAPAAKAKPAAKPAAAINLGAHGIMDSAQQIWQTGVKALGRAQQEGTRLFEALVKEGAGVEKRTRSMAAGKVNAVRDSVESHVGQVKGRAADTWDRLEKVFEERVQRALTRLGVPGREELQSLIDRVDELNGRLRTLAASPAPTEKKAPAAGKAPADAKPATAKKAAARTSAPAKKPAAPAKAKPAAAKPAAAKPKAPVAKKTAEAKPATPAPASTGTPE